MENKVDFENRIELDDLNQAINNVKQEVRKVIVGQDKVLDLLLVAMLSNGHVLIEGVPGIAKTLMAKLVAKSVSVDFSRIQFTPDLMPSDILGTSIFNTKKSDFEFRKGPIFSNLILIDEINRSPAKTQSALFEVMEERQISIDGISHIMQDPFLVFATQNPIDQEGTYRLPEAQLDRFIFKIKVGYPSLEEEEQILTTHQNLKGEKELDKIKPQMSAKQLISFQKKVQLIHIDDKLKKYIAQIVDKTRNNRDLYLGASPRASINIMNGSKAFAALQGRDFITPEDIQTIASPVLNHRIQLSPEKEMEGLSPEDVIKQIINSIEVPR